MRFLFRIIAAFAGLIAVFVFLTVATTKLQMGSFHRTPVGPVPPGAMPVLVVDRDSEGRPVDARIVRYRYLGSLPRAAQSRSFEAATGEEGRINDLIAAGCRANIGAGSGEGRVSRLAGSVHREIGADGAVMRVEDTSSSDYVRIGRYMPEDRGIVALSYQYYFGPGVVLMSMAISAAVCSLILLIAVLIATRRCLMPRSLFPPTPNP